MASQLRGHNGRRLYREQTDEVLAISAALTDEQKMIAELFENKLFSLGFVTLFVSQSRGHSLDTFVQFDFLVNVAAFDSGIALWQEKTRWDAVRPFSAIRYLYGDREVTAWAGPGKGTRSDILGSEWRSYLNTADHPEYPSGSACFCAAHAQASRRFLGSDELRWPQTFPAGSSVIEPGVTPAADVQTVFPTWTDFAQRCGQARLWAGVHFRAAVDEGARLCRPIGDKAYAFLRAHIDGSAPPPR